MGISWQVCTVYASADCAQCFGCCALLPSRIHLGGKGFCLVPVMKPVQPGGQGGHVLVAHWPRRGEPWRRASEGLGRGILGPQVLLFRKGTYPEALGSGIRVWVRVEAGNPGKGGRGASRRGPSRDGHLTAHLLEAALMFQYIVSGLQTSGGTVMYLSAQKFGLHFFFFRISATVPNEEGAGVRNADIERGGQRGSPSDLPLACSLSSGT